MISVLLGSIFNAVWKRKEKTDDILMTIQCEEEARPERRSEMKKEEKYNGGK